MSASAAADACLYLIVTPAHCADACLLPLALTFPFILAVLFYTATFLLPRSAEHHVENSHKQYWSMSNFVLATPYEEPAEN